MRAPVIAVGAFVAGMALATSVLLPLAHRRVTMRAVAGSVRALVTRPGAEAADGSAEVTFWGDSLTQGGDATPGHDFPTLIGFLFHRDTVNRGKAGESSGQIRDRMLSRPVADGPERAVIWAGRNDDLDDPSATEAHVRSMVESLRPGSHVLVLGILNGDLKRERRGGDRYAAVLRVNEALRTRYGSSYLPIRELLVAQGRAGDGDDQDAAEADTVPPSLRTDALHLNDRGQAAVAYAVERAMEQNGW